MKQLVRPQQSSQPILWAKDTLKQRMIIRLSNWMLGIAAIFAITAIGLAFGTDDVVTFSRTIGSIGLVLAVLGSWLRYRRIAYLSIRKHEVATAHRYLAEKA